MPVTLRQTNLLDVTLRDGGYLNDWNFTNDELINIVRLTSSLGADIIELGYVSSSDRLHLAASLPSDLLERIRAEFPAIMSAAMLRPCEDYKGALRERRDLVDLIRIPCGQQDLTRSLEIVAEGLNLGFEMSLNLTSVSSYNLSELSGVLQIVARSNLRVLVCLADSRGALRPAAVRRLVGLVRRSIPQSIGFHAHDNRKWAVENSLTALDAGAVVIDGSLEGYGLGGGNANLAVLSQALGRGTATQQPLPTLERGRSPSLSSLYQLSGLKNLEQEWVAPLFERYQSTAEAILSRLPRRRYQTLSEVTALCETYAPH